MVDTEIRLIIFFAAKDGGLYGQQKQDWELTVAQVMTSLLPNSDLNWSGHHGVAMMVAIMVNKRVWNAVLGCNLKNERIISVYFQGKPFSITVIQVYAPTSNAEEAEVERFYEDL